jgi:hypothetical protein
MRRALRLLLATVAVVVCAAPASALAAGEPTATSVTSPGAGALPGPIVYDGATYPFTVSGTSNGTTGGAVDLRCYHLNPDGTVGFANVKQGVPLNADGSFSAVGNAGNVAFVPCVLTAVPAAAFPTDLSPFHGPQVSAATTSTTVETAAPNAGKVYDYYDSATFPRAYADFGSLGRCGLEDMAVFGPRAAGQLQQNAIRTFYCNAGYVDNVQLGASGPYRSGVTVDGVNAYFASGAHDIDSAQIFPGLAHTVTYDGTTMRIVEHDSLVRCPANVTDANTDGTNCGGAFTALGVSVTRTTTVSHDGRVVAIADDWRSSTGPHAIGLLQDQDFAPGAGANVYRFPGQTAFASLPSMYAHVALPAAGAPVSLLNRASAATDGFAAPVTSITMSPAPDDAISQANDSSRFVLHFAFGVPASGAFTAHEILAGETTAGALAPLTREAEDRLSGPRVAIASPGAGTTVHASPVTVTGTVADNVGARVTVNGVAATVAGGTFHATVPLARGTNRLTAVATDATGNATSATRTVTYAPPAPPKATVRRRGTVRAALVHGRVVVSTGLSVACPAGKTSCRASTAIRLAAKKGKTGTTLGTTKTTIRPGRSAAPKVTLTRTAGRRLTRSRTLKVTISTSARVGSGPSVRATRSTTLRRPKPHRH